ncbi:MAG: hypothetical protein ABR610_17285 [Thermoanaerobaculia bacterium]
MVCALAVAANARAGEWLRYVIHTAEDAGRGTGITQGKIAVPGEIVRESGITPFVDAPPGAVELRRQGVAGEPSHGEGAR